MKYTFLMRDAWGDDYELQIEASTQDEALKIASRIDDDAVPNAEPIRTEP